MRIKKYETNESVIFSGLAGYRLFCMTCAYAFFFLLLLLPYYSRAAEEKTRPLSLKQSVSLALKNNDAVLLAGTQAGVIHGEEAGLWARLLPQVSLGAYQQKAWRKSSNIELSPFDSFNSKIAVSQRIFDLTALAKAEAGKIKWKKSLLEKGLAQEEVILVTASTYIEVLRMRGKIKAARKDIGLARQLLVLAQHQLNGGLASRVDVTRAKTQLAGQKARIQGLKLNEYHAQLELKRIIGIPLSENIELTDSLSLQKRVWPEIGKALRDVLNNRLEIRIALAQLDYSSKQLLAAKYQRLPKIEVSADYGVSAPVPQGNLEDVSEGSLRVSLPVWEGGNIKADIKRQTYLKKADKIKLDQLYQKIEEDIRFAFEGLRSSRAQVSSHREVARLALKELKLAKDRFAAGIDDNIEVIDAETVLAQARDSYAQALAQYEQACLNLYGALGDAGGFDLKTNKKEGNNE